MHALPLLPGKFLKSGPLRIHSQHSGAKIRVFKQNTDIIKFWPFYSAVAHEFLFIYLFLLANSFEPLVVLLQMVVSYKCK